MSDRDIFIIQTSRRGARGDLDTGSLEWSVIRGEVDELLSRSAIDALDDLADVDAPSPSSGQVLAWNGSAWEPVALTGGMAQIWDGDEFSGPYDRLNPIAPLYLLDDDPVQPGMAKLGVQLGGIGVSNLPARSDHTHTNPAPARTTFGPGGYLSSGTRTLASTNVTLAAGISYVVEATLRVQMRGADPGACYYRASVSIAGNTRQSTGGVNGFWCVQGVPREQTWEHERTITGTGAAISISAAVAYDSGGGFYTDAGELVVRLRPAR